MSNWEIKAPDCYMSFSNGAYRVIHKGMPISDGKKTMVEAAAVAMQFKLTMSSISWNGDMGLWVAASTLGTSNELHVPGSLSRYSIEVE
jgi:hypothetical protein